MIHEYKIGDRIRWKGSMLRPTPKYFNSEFWPIGATGTIIGTRISYPGATTLNVEIDASVPDIFNPYIVETEKGDADPRICWVSEKEIEPILAHRLHRAVNAFIHYLENL